MSGTDMSQTKKCPACKKEIPASALRCRHCMIRISIPPPAAPTQEEKQPETTPVVEEKEEAAPKTNTSPPPPPTRASIPPPSGSLPPKRTSLPPPPPAGAVEKKTSDEKKVVVPAASSNSDARKRSVRPSSLVKKPDVLGDKKEQNAFPKPVLGIGDAKTLLGAPAARTEEPKVDDVEELVSAATAGMSVSREKVPVDSTDEFLLNLGDDTEEISLDDISQLVSTETKQQDSVRAKSEATEKSTTGGNTKAALDKAASAVTSAASAAMERVSMAPAAVKSQYNKLQKSDGPVSVLFRPLIPADTTGKLPGGAFLGKVLVYHAALLGLAIVILVVVLVSIGGDEEPEPAPKVAVVAPSEPEKAATVEAQAPVPLEPKEEPFVENCKTFDAYPEFPWKEHIATLVDGTEAKGICGLVKASPALVEKLFAKQTHIGPTGFDLLKGGEIFKMYPTEQTHRVAPSVSFVFVNDALYEIHFDYKGEVADKLPLDLFKSSFSDTFSQTGADGKDQKTSFVDGDTLVNRNFKKDIYERVTNRIVFASKGIKAKLGNRNKKRLSAEVSVEKGISLLGQKKFTEAAEAFRKARRDIPSFGGSYTWEGIALLQQERFDAVEVAAKKALEVTADRRSKAEASGLLAVVALYNGDKAKAVELFGKASELDPTNGEFESSTKELTSGKYEHSRVAKTAARLKCLDGNSGIGTRKGILARGNFPDSETYKKVFGEVEGNKTFQAELKKWVSWTCPTRQ